MFFFCCCDLGTLSRFLTRHSYKMKSAVGICYVAYMCIKHTSVSSCKINVKFNKYKPAEYTVTSNRSKIHKIVGFPNKKDR